jgi:hypothetical protein
LQRAARSLWDGGAALSRLVHPLDPNVRAPFRYLIQLASACRPVAACAVGLAWAAVPVGASTWGDERWVLTPDLAVRHVRDETTGRHGERYNLVLDAYGKLGTAHRDIATVVAQVYLSRLERHPAPPAVFDGPTDTEVLPTINTVNLHLTEDRRLNLKVGHLELPYGLETTITNAGELRSFTMGANTGLGVDWGATLNGTLERFQYEVGVGRGSGMFYADNFDPYSLFGRIGSPVDSETYGGTTGWGFSVFRGKVLNPARTAVLQRERVALDGGRLVAVEGEGLTLDVDLLLLALGFVGPELGGAQAALGLTLDARGNIKTDRGLWTGVPGIYAAGDVARGASLIVWAISQGREAARSVDAWLQGRASHLPTRGADLAF